MPWLEQPYLDLVVGPARERDRRVDGNVGVAELDVIAGLVHRHKTMALFEIGTFNGRTTLNLAAFSPPAARVYTLCLRDPGAAALTLHPDDAQHIGAPGLGEYFRGSDVEPKITQLLGDSATFDYGPYLGRMDFVFVDGSHSPEYARSDTNAALALAAPGALIVWHDYASSFPGVNDVLDSLAHTRPMVHVAQTTLAYTYMPGRTSRPEGE